MKNIRRIFQIDYRSLAAFRFALAIASMTVLLNSESSCTSLCGGLHLIAAVSLFFGWYTRLANFVCLIMLCFLPPMASQGNAEVLLRLLTFWGLFLPIGARWSIDSALASNQAKGVLSDLCSAALIIQISIIYLFGELVHYIHTQNYQLILLLLSILLIFSPFKNARCRMLTIIAFALMHYYSLINSDSQFYDWVCLSMFLVLIPSEVWNYLAVKLRRPNYHKIEIFYDGDCGFCKKCALILIEFLGFSRSQIQAAQNNVEIEDTMRCVNSWVVRDHKGAIYTEFKAGIILCGSWWILDPLKKILLFPPVFRTGNWCYRMVANNRQRLGLITRYLTNKPLKSKSHWSTQILALIFMIFVMVCNILKLNQLQFTNNYESYLHYICTNHCKLCNWNRGYK